MSISTYQGNNLQQQQVNGLNSHKKVKFNILMNFNLLPSHVKRNNILIISLILMDNGYDVVCQERPESGPSMESSHCWSLIQVIQV